FPQIPSGNSPAYFLPLGGSWLASGFSGLGVGISCVQVSPPSRDTYSPLPGPPLVISHGRRRACHSPAKRMRGLAASKQTSDAPVSASLNTTRFHVSPPSVVRYTPRSGLGPNAWPSTAAYAMRGSCGCTIIVPICPSCFQTCFQVLPASVDL